MSNRYSLSVDRERFKDRFRLVGVAGKFAWLDGVMVDVRLSLLARLIAHRLVLKYWGDGGAFPSMLRLADDLGRSERMVQYAIRELKVLGYLKVWYREGQSSIFEPLWPISQLSVGVQSIAPPRVDKSSVGVQSIAPPPCNPLHPNPSSESKVRSGAENAVRILGYDPGPDFDDCFNDR